MSNTNLNRKFKKATLIILGLYVMIGTTLYFIQEKILFRPTVLPQEYVYQFSEPFEEVFLKTNDDAIINAIHFKVANPKGAILYFHGNAGDLSRWGTIAEFFVKQGYDVFIMDYRTYGKSTGFLSEQSLYDDAQLCYDYLLKRYDEESITLYGRSLGTGIATNVASHNRPKQLILETPYYSMVDVAQHRFPIFPVKYLLKYKIKTFDFIKKVKCPITIFHGTDDSVVAFESGKKLFDELPKERARFIQIDGGNHNNLIEFEGYRQGIENLLK
ncbi:MAG: alpha/beta fold hydrolase [Gelidibacter sp.]